MPSTTVTHGVLEATASSLTIELTARPRAPNTSTKAAVRMRLTDSPRMTCSGRASRSAVSRPRKYPSQVGSMAKPHGLTAVTMPRVNGTASPTLITFGSGTRIVSREVLQDRCGEVRGVEAAVVDVGQGAARVDEGGHR